MHEPFTKSDNIYRHKENVSRFHKVEAMLFDHNAMKFDMKSKTKETERPLHSWVKGETQTEKTF